MNKKTIISILLIAIVTSSLTTVLIDYTSKITFPKLTAKSTPTTATPSPQTTLYPTATPQPTIIPAPMPSSSSTNDPTKSISVELKSTSAMLPIGTGLFQIPDLAVTNVGDSSVTLLAIGCTTLISFEQNPTTNDLTNVTYWSGNQVLAPNAYVYFPSTTVNWITSLTVYFEVSGQLFYYTQTYNSPQI